MSTNQKEINIVPRPKRKKTEVITRFPTKKSSLQQENPYFETEQNQNESDDDYIPRKCPKWSRTIFTLVNAPMLLWENGDWIARVIGEPVAPSIVNCQTPGILDISTFAATCEAQRILNCWSIFLRHFIRERDIAENKREIPPSPTTESTTMRQANFDENEFFKQYIGKMPQRHPAMYGSHDDVEEKIVENTEKVSNIILNERV